MCATTQDPLKRMADEIRKKQEMTRALQLAAKRQRYMLPKEVNVPGYEIASVYRPCSDVSGDFYDIIPLDSGRQVAMFIGDVSGHGIEAALFMGMGKMALGLFARQYRAPTEVLSRANEALAEELDSETFISALYALLETDTGRLTVGRAGHPKPVIFNPQRSPVWSYIEPKGVVLGMARGQMFKKSLVEAELILQPNDTFFIFTDGLVEAHDRNNEQFGNDRMLEAIVKHGKSGPHQLIAALLKEVETFLGGKPLEDDVTLIAVQRLK
jgi:sigma-B regulation protein RsbU (phosphoserine phosphatase)